MTATIYINCERCALKTKRNAPTQRFCPSCSEIRHVETKRRYYHAHKGDPDFKEREKVNGVKSRKKMKSLKIEAGKQNSVMDMDEVWKTLFSGDIDYDTKIMFRFPYSVNLSKNNTWRTVGRGHVYLRREAQEVRDELIWEIKSRIASAKRRSGFKGFKENKVWVSIYVAKPDNRSDAINVIDSVMDAVKEAIGVDDRWFAIQRLDWTIAKNDPSIFIAIAQRTEDIRVCSYCGRMRPLSMYRKHKGKRLGIGRECKKCLSLANAMARRNSKSK